MSFNIFSIILFSNCCAGLNNEHLLQYSTENRVCNR